MFLKKYIQTSKPEFAQWLAVKDLYSVGSNMTRSFKASEHQRVFQGEFQDKDGMVDLCGKTTLRLQFVVTASRPNNHKTFDARLWQTVKKKKKWTWHSSAVHSSFTVEEFCSKTNSFMLIIIKKSTPTVCKHHSIQASIVAFVSRQKLSNSTSCSFKCTFPLSPTLFLLMRCKTKLKA